MSATDLVSHSSRNPIFAPDDMPTRGALSKTRSPYTSTMDVPCLCSVRMIGERRLDTYDLFGFPSETFATLGPNAEGGARVKCPGGDHRPL